MRLRKDQIEVFKILNGYENRWIYKFSFSQRTVNEWSRLSADCVGAIIVMLICLKIKLTYT